MPKYLLLCMMLCIAWVDAFAQPTQSTGPVYKEHSVTIKRGDTLLKILKRLKIQDSDIDHALIAMRKVYDPGNLSIGQKVNISYEVSKKPHVLHHLSLKASKIKDVHVKRLPSSVFLGYAEEQKLYKKLIRASVKIDRTLFTSAEKMNMPIPLMMELIKWLSFDVDFQRDIRSGNRLTVLFEQQYTKDKQAYGTGTILYASLKLNTRSITMYRFLDANKREDYYDEKGFTIRKSLLMTPVDGARITSNYGMRKHPILGYSKMHKGIDFGAPTGTPIYAAGDGKIKELGRKGSYGKYIRIDHANGFSTAYAHLSRYGKGKRRGKYVKQGDVIGYVGSTGRSTGPHLHYEVLRNGKHINPLSIRTSSGKKLTGPRRGIFLQYKKQINAILKKG